MEMLPVMEGDSFDLDLEATSFLWNKDLEVPSNYSLYEKFFDMVGRTLRFLVLEIDVGEDHHASAITRLLAKCQCLKSISIDVSHSWQARPMFFLWFRPILQVLATACASRLEELTIVCKLSSNIELNQYLPWILLDRNLSDTHLFPNFNKLRIRAHALIIEQHRASLWPGDEDRMKATAYTNLRRLMLRLTIAGVLDIEQCDSGNCPKVMSIQ
ncbi:hypothetical protein BDZ89DRAFT_31219 [Hymenopellis radicata]|nr:hypothetical protein BDZ89DRAFT_31219 [Hymenopellis radicata]